MLRYLRLSLLICFIALTMRLLLGSGSVVELTNLRLAIDEQQDAIKAIKQGNADLYTEIDHLKREPTAMEEQARYELGMIKQGESYYQVVEPVE